MSVDNLSGTVRAAVACVFVAQFVSFSAAAASRDGEAPRGRTSVQDTRDAPVHIADTKIKDANGKVRYIVDLIENTNGKPQRFLDATSKIA